MDLVITGVIGIVLFAMFVGGLAHSIGQFPFTVIAVLIGLMAVYGLYEEIKESRDNNQD